MPRSQDKFVKFGIWINYRFEDIQGDCRPDPPDINYSNKVGKIKWWQVPQSQPRRAVSLMDKPSSHPRCGSSVLNDFNRNWPFLGLTKRKKGCRRAFTCALFQRGRRFEQSFWVEVQPCYSFSLLLYESLYGGFSFWYTGRDALNLKGCELLWRCGEPMEWVLVVTIWHIPLDVAVDVWRRWLFAPSIVRSPHLPFPQT